MQTTLTTRRGRLLKSILVIGGALIVLIALIAWGGTATGGPIFALGVAAFLGLFATFGGLTWWLLFSPLPGGAKPASVRDPSARQLLSCLVLIGVALYVGGFFWDEVWHRVYGTFGDDFLWPPHFMIYSSLALIAGFAGYGLHFVLVGRGSLRQRIRTEPMIALVGLVAAFLVVSVPSDVVWHQIYGKDITAWSLPHLTLFVGSAIVALVGMSLQLSVMPIQPWQGLRGLRRQEWIAIGQLALAVIALVQIGTTEWEGIPAPSSIPGASFLEGFWHRPEWLYPVVVVTIGVFYGALIVRALKRTGAATIVGLIVLAARIVSLALVSGESVSHGLGAISHALIIVPFTALDVWYALRRKQADSLSTLIIGNLLAGVVFLIAGLPVINAAMSYPRVNGDTLPGMIVMALIMSPIAGWAGARLGGWLGSLERVSEPAPVARRVVRASIGAALVAAALVLTIVLTARPPSA